MSAMLSSDSVPPRASSTVVRRLFPWHRAGSFSFSLALVFVLFLARWGVGAEAAAGLSATGKVEEASQELRTYLQLQEQIHATQLAVESNRQVTTETTLRTAEALAVRMQAIEQSLGSQRAHELDAMQSSNRVMLIVAGTFAGMGFLAMALMGYFQWRTINRLAEISAAIPASHRHGLGAARPLPALGAGDSGAQGKSELLGAVHQLEKRIDELEHVSTVPLQNGNPDTHTETNNGDDAHSHNGN